MMDPLSAFGLAANIVQFIDFGSSLVSQTKEVINVGSTISTKHLQIVTSDLQGFIDSFKQHLQPQTGLPRVQEEQALYDLVEECELVAEELVSCLNQIRVRGRKGDRWGSICTAIKTVWRQDRIDNLQCRLNDYRQQLSLRVLLLFNTHFARHNDKLKSLQDGHHDIIEVIGIASESLKASLTDLHIQQQDWQLHQSAISERRHAETIAAIVTTGDGTSRTVAGPSHYIHDADADSANDTHTATTHGSVNEISQGDIGTTVESGSFSKIAQHILDALHFRSIADRRSAVQEAHVKTFEWIYKDPLTSHKPWDNFSNWLKSGSGCYWIHGKAGSGKSTLMKYIQEKSTTMTLLHQWAGNSQLIVASFFFWYSGSSLQKSQSGLLRSLLFDVLSKRVDLIPVLFPDRCRSLLAGQFLSLESPTYIELREAFTTLVQRTPDRLKICFMIDGVDEYEGDQDELCNLFSEATTWQSTKVLLSSRPTPSCVHAFSLYPSLRLQDLTEEDIRCYVDDKLGQHPLMRKLETAEPGATTGLVSVITAKATGVFLWIVLVAKRLREGLQDYDTVSDLRQKVDELPPNLERLYEQMMGSMSSQNRRQGSKLLQIVLRSTETHDNYPITLLQLSFAEDEDYQKLVDDRRSLLEASQVAWRCEVMEGRLRSRCCGLLEVQGRSNEAVTKLSSKHVGFLHRTVVDFLRTNTIWSQIVSMTAGTSFNAEQALFSSALADLKATYPFATDLLDLSPGGNNALARLLTYERHIHNGKSWFHSVILPELKHTLSLSWHDEALFQAPEAQYQTIEKYTSEVSELYVLPYHMSFLLFAASQCSGRELMELCGYFDFYIDGPVRFDTNENVGTMLAAYLLLQHVDAFSVPLKIAASKNLFFCSALPNIPVDLPTKHRKSWDQRWKAVPPQRPASSWTLWEFFLNYTLSILDYDEANFVEWIKTGLPSTIYDMIIQLVLRGSDLTASIGGARGVRLAPEIIRDLMVRVECVLRSPQSSCWLYSNSERELLREQIEAIKTWFLRGHVTRGKERPSTKYYQPEYWNLYKDLSNGTDCIRRVPPTCSQPRCEVPSSGPSGPSPDNLGSQAANTGQPVPRTSPQEPFMPTSELYRRRVLDFHKGLQEIAGRHTAPMLV